ncbi:hypothetical protein IE53DRAFT_369590 [Violaceomyces palustris]|uniref:Uncharacterized protein n=1 Tax=Violaceomyces palustris TaxID=1673888 RepID=A0ACD0NV40_9BASI|nr:hypothetical protein IE53DRAFT_369590 [Violaceomyces palustris]
MFAEVNHPAFHALVFLLGVIIVLSRYVKGNPLTDTLQTNSFLVMAPLYDLGSKTASVAGLSA